MQVVLSPSELQLAASIGIQRQIEALKMQLPDQFGAKQDNGWQIHIEGACGELAVAKFLNIHWNGSINTFRSGADVAQNIQVRTRSQDHYELIVRDNDRLEDIFVLITGIAPNYTIKGWTYGAIARNSQWLKNHGNRTPAWFVPQERLFKPDALVALIKQIRNV